MTAIDEPRPPLLSTQSTHSTPPAACASYQKLGHYREAERLFRHSVAVMEPTTIPAGGESFVEARMKDASAAVAAAEK